MFVCECLLQQIQVLLAAITLNTHSVTLISLCDTRNSVSFSHSLSQLNSSTSIYFDCMLRMLAGLFCENSESFCLFVQQRFELSENICFEFTSSYPAYIMELITLNRFASIMLLLFLLLMYFSAQQTIRKRMTKS